MRYKMKVLLEKIITMNKVYQVKALPPKENSKYKYRLYVNGLAKTLYENLDDAYEHIENLTYGLDDKLVPDTAFVVKYFGDWKKDNV